MKNQTTYTIQFWHGGEAVWKNNGNRPFDTLEKARECMKANAELCDYMVDFRIVEVY